jgi:hypothetical protein
MRRWFGFLPRGAAYVVSLDWLKRWTLQKAFDRGRHQSVIMAVACDEHQSNRQATRAAAKRERCASEPGRDEDRAFNMLAASSNFVLLFPIF